MTRDRHRERAPPREILRQLAASLGGAKVPELRGLLRPAEPVEEKISRFLHRAEVAVTLNQDLHHLGGWHGVIVVQFHHLPKEDEITATLDHSLLHRKGAEDIVEVAEGNGVEDERMYSQGLCN